MCTSTSKYIARYKLHWPKWNNSAMSFLISAHHLIVGNDGYVVLLWFDMNNVKADFNHPEELMEVDTGAKYVVVFDVLLHYCIRRFVEYWWIILTMRHANGLFLRSVISDERRSARD